MSDVYAVIHPGRYEMTRP